MGWTLTLNGLATSLEAERAVIDKIAEFLADLGEEVAHVWTTDFHGAGDTNNLLKNVAPAPEEPAPAGPVSPVEPVTATDDAARPTGTPLGEPFDPKAGTDQSTPPAVDPGASQPETPAESATDGGGGPINPLPPGQV